MAFEDYVPCNNSECGWHIQSEEAQKPLNLKNLLGLASIQDRDRGERPLLVNQDRFSREARYKVEGEEKSYCEHLPKNCREKIVVVKTAAAIP